jgi:hypothetical protein
MHTPLPFRRWIDNNSLQGRLPARFPCSFPHLGDFQAAHNNLTGTIPVTWLGNADSVASAWNMSLESL